MPLANAQRHVNWTTSLSIQDLMHERRIQARTLPVFSCLFRAFFVPRQVRSIDVDGTFLLLEFETVRLLVNEAKLCIYHLKPWYLILTQLLSLYAVNFLSSDIFQMAAGNSYCYLPDGDLVQEDTPCSSDEEVSPCCGEESVCVANGLCLKTKPKFLYRGTCTDHTWNSPSCPQFCTKSSFV